MAETKEFQEWIRVETARRCGEIEEIKKKVEEEIKNIKYEIRVDGLWTEVDCKREEDNGIE